MYHVNGYKFNIIEWGRGKKIDNTRVYVRGDIGDGESDWHGVVNKILESEYLGKPLTRVVLFACKWYDLTYLGGTCKYNHYKIIVIDHTKRYEKFDLFIIAQNARQVYYLPYLGQYKSN